MPLISSYLQTTKNLEPFFNGLITAQAPETFTQKFLENLEFKSTNDRLFISLLKGLGFLDDTGKPTERYFKFLDQTQSKRILADAVREAYGDLFAVNKKANELTAQEVKNKLRTLTQGKNSEKVLGHMASTFKALVDYSEWGESSEKKDEEKKSKNLSEQDKVIENENKIIDDEDNLDKKSNFSNESSKMQLHYNIQIHLPETRDQAVYDALFKSLKKHLF